MFLTKSKPYDKNINSSIQSDCLIINSISRYLKNRKKYKVHFYCKNKKDFSDNNGNIHPDIKIKKINYYEKFKDLDDKLFKSGVSDDIIEKLDIQTEEVFTNQNDVQTSTSPNNELFRE